MTFFRRAKTHVTNLIHDWQYARMLEKTLAHTTDATQSVTDVFEQVNDDFWFWLYTEGYRRNKMVRQLLPSLPAERIQIQFTGGTGDETLHQAFSAYQLFKEIMQQSLYPISQQRIILDFGCGWGRVTRFFSKEVAPENLHGIDCDPEIIEVCNASNLPGNFTSVAPIPPTHFPENSFDYIYSYSVFSHLSEESHNAWLKEFQRILKPGGLLIVTTRPRDFILICADLKKAKDVPAYAKGAALSFANTEECLAQYDDGEYCFSYTGGDGVREGSFYGETCIPKQYVEKEWGRYLDVLNYLECRTHQRFDQNVIVARKPIKSYE